MGQTGTLRVRALRGLSAAVCLGALLGLLAVVDWADRPEPPAPHDALLGGATPPAREVPDDPFALPRQTLRFMADEARILGPFENKLEHLSERYARELGIEIHVVTRAAADRDLDALASEVFDERGLDARSGSGGVLIFIDPAGSRARIEVSYGLEGLFPDAWVGRAAHYQLAPYASYRDVGMAVSDVMYLLGARALDQARSGAWVPPERVRDSPAFQERLRNHVSGGAGSQALIPRGPADGDLKRRIPEERRQRYAPSPFIGESVAAYVRVLDELAGDPELELFTPGSQCMRDRYPVAPFEYWERAEVLEASQPYEIRVEGDRAVVHSEAPEPGFVPVLLHRMDGLWRVDAAAIWANLFTSERSYSVMNRLNPYMFGLTDGSARGSHPTNLPLDLGGESPREALARLDAALQQGPSAERHFEAAEILFRNCWAAMDALERYEQAARLAPDDRRILERVADRLIYTHFFLAATPYLKALGPSHYELLAWTFSRADRLEEAAHYYRLALERAPSSRTRRALTAVERELARQG